MNKKPTGSYVSYLFLEELYLLYLSFIINCKLREGPTDGCCKSYWLSTVGPRKCYGLLSTVGLKRNCPPVIKSYPTIDPRNDLQTYKQELVSESVSLLSLVIKKWMNSCSSGSLIARLLYFLTTIKLKLRKYYWNLFYLVSRSLQELSFDLISSSNGMVKPVTSDSISYLVIPVLFQIM